MRNNSNLSAYGNGPVGREMEDFEAREETCYINILPIAVKKQWVQISRSNGYKYKKKLVLEKNK